MKITSVFGACQQAYLLFKDFLVSTHAEPVAGGHTTIELQNKLIYDKLLEVYNPLRSSIPIKVHSKPTFIPYPTSFITDVSRYQFCPASINSELYVMNDIQIYKVNSTLESVLTLRSKFSGSILYFDQVVDGWDVFTYFNNYTGNYFRKLKFTTDGLLSQTDTVDVPFYRPEIPFVTKQVSLETYSATVGLEYVQSLYSSLQVLGSTDWQGTGNFYINRNWSAQKIESGYLVSVKDAAYELGSDGTITALHTFSQPGFETGNYTFNEYGIRRQSRNGFLYKNGDYYYIFRDRHIERYV